MKVFVVTLIALTSLVALLVSIQSPAPAVTVIPPAPLATLRRSFVEYKVGGLTVEEFVLADGTRCITIAGNTVTCEWRQSVVLVPPVQ